MLITGCNYSLGHSFDLYFAIRDRGYSGEEIRQQVIECKKSEVLRRNNTEIISTRIRYLHSLTSHRFTQFVRQILGLNLKRHRSQPPLLLWMKRIRRNRPTTGKGRRVATVARIDAVGSIEVLGMTSMWYTTGSHLHDLVKADLLGLFLFVAVELEHGVETLRRL